MYTLLFIKSYSGKLMLSGNPIEYTAAVTPFLYNAFTSGLYIVATIKLQNNDANNLFTVVKSQKIYPESNGLINLDISSIAEAYLSYFVPPVSQDNTVRCSSQVKTFLVELTLFNGTENIATLSDEVRILKAGKSYEYFNPDSEYAISNLDPKLLIEKNPESTEKVFANDVFFLYLTIPMELGYQPYLVVELNYLNQAGVLAQKELQPFSPLAYTSKTTVVCIPAGFKQLGLHTQLLEGEVPVSYSILVNYTSGGPVYTLTQINCTLEQRNFYNSKQLLYRNSLGSLLPIRLKGIIDSEASYEQQLTGTTPLDFLQDGNIVGTQLQVNAAEDWKQKGETGFITKFEAERLRDFFLSNERYELKDGRLIPVIINNKAIKYPSNNDNLCNISIEWQHAFKNNFYSQPDPVVYGCPAMLSFVATQFLGTAINVFWSLPAGYDYFRVSILFPGEEPIYEYVSGNRGTTMVSFVRPASASGTVTLQVKAQVVCNRYNKVPSFGPELTATPITLAATTGPVAVPDIFTMIPGFTTPQTFGTSILANDYDPNGAALTATAVTNVATTQGGIISITADGIVTYTPPDAAFTGEDTYVYTLNAGAATTTGTIVFRISSVTGNIFAASGIGYTVMEGFVTIPFDLYIQFFDRPLSITPIPVSNLSVNYRITVKTYTGADNFTTPTSTVNTDYTSVFNAARTKVYTGRLVEFIADSLGFNSIKKERSVTILPGTGYTVL